MKKGKKRLWRNIYRSRLPQTCNPPIEIKHDKRNDNNTGNREKKWKNQQERRKINDWANKRKGEYNKRLTIILYSFFFH